MQKNQRKAFTLLELLVVIAIIGILISLGVASFSNAQRKARDSRRREDIKSVQNGLEQYYANNNGSYPVGTNMSTLITNANLGGGNYFPAGAPVDPKNVSPYIYYVTSTTTTYCICARLETNGAGNSASSACNYPGNPKNFFCVSNLQ